jgi:hypothetical protein
MGSTKTQAIGSIGAEKTLAQQVKPRRQASISQYYRTTQVYLNQVSNMSFGGTEFRVSRKGRGKKKGARQAKWIVS